MLTIDNIVVTVGEIVIRGFVEIDGALVSVDITLPPSLRLTLDQLNALAGFAGGISPADQAALTGLQNRAEGETAALEALDTLPKS